MVSREGRLHAGHPRAPRAIFWHGGPTDDDARRWRHVRQRSRRDRGLAEDCVQETFLRAWRARDGFDATRGSGRTWLFAIARNVVVDAARARSRRLRLVTDDGDALDHALAAASAPGDLAEDLAARIQVSDALSRLSEDHRTVVVEVQMRGRSYDELAAHLDVSVGTLRSRMFYGLRALRSTLEEAGWTNARS